MQANDKGSAEDRFRAAFERLKSDTPTHIARGSALTQNNIAREAGLDPSALKKSRFPELIQDIQNWKKSEQPGQSQLKPNHKIAKRHSSSKQKLSLMKKQRDIALQLLAEADSLIIILNRKLEDAGIMSDCVDRLNQDESSAGTGFDKP
jgi:hypothetical protein